jgi:hypothetical protein
MKKAKTKKSSNKGGSKNSKAKKPSRQQQEINQALAASAAAQASADSAIAAAAANAANTSTAVSTAAVQSTAAAAQSTSAAQDLATAISNAAAQSTSAAQQLSTATSNAAAQSTAQANISALQSVIVAGGTNGVSIVGGINSNTAFAVGNAANFSATLGGDTLGAAILQNASNTPYTINVSSVTGTRSWYLTGGSTQDTYIFSSGTQLGQSVITSGGTNTDTIMFSQAATVTDSQFSKIVAGTYAVTGTNGALSISVGSTAQAAGVSLVTGGTAADSFTDALTSGTTAFTLVSGGGDDTFTFANTTRLSTDYITAGAGAETIVLTTDGQSVVNSAFARITGTLESLSLANGNNSIVLGTNARNIGLTSVTTGSGDDYFNIPVAFTNASTFSAGDGADTFVIGNTSSATFLGGNGNDTFSSAQTGAWTFNSSLIGGAGTDVLAFSGVQTSIVDSGFSNALTIETITSTGTLSAVLGSNAARAGLVTVNGSTYGDSITYQGTAAITFIGGSGADSFVASSASASTFSGGDGNDSFAFASTAALLAASVDGGAGSNTINFSNAVSAQDSAFSRIAAGTVQALTVLTGTGDSSIIVGSNALAAGITSINAGTRNDYIVANYGTNPVTLNGGGGADNLGGSAAIATNSSNVYFSFANLENYTGSQMFANSAGTNVLAFSGGLTINDANFTNASNIQTVMFNGTSSQVSLSSNGATVGFTTMSAANSTGGSSFTFAGSFTNAISFIGSSGNDTFVVNDITGFTAATTINAGAGTSDTLRLAPGIVTNDSTFANIAAGTMEVLSGTAGAALTVGSNAALAGINTVYAGTTGVTVASSFGTGAISLSNPSGGSGLAAGGVTFTINRQETGNTSITASSTASDTLLLTNTGAQTLGTVIGIDTITYTAGSTLTLSSGFYQGTSGTTIDFSSNTNAITFTASVGTTGVQSQLSLIGNSATADTFVGGINADALQGWNGTNSSSLVDSLTGGLGADNFVLGTNTGNRYTGTGYAFIADFGLGGSDKISVDDYTGDNTGYVFGLTGTFFTLTQTSSNQILAQGNLSGAYASYTQAGLTSTITLL